MSCLEQLVNYFPPFASAIYVLTAPTLYENLPMQYAEIFLALKIENFQQKLFYIFLIFAQNIDFGYTLEPPLTSTHNLCFGAKIRKIGIPLHSPVLLYKSEV